MKVTTKQLARTLYELTDSQSKPEIEKSVASFALYMYRERKLKLAGKIIGQFKKIYNQEKNIIEAEITSCRKISEAIESKAKHFIKEKYQAKEVVLKNIVDPQIKGGIVLKVGDEVTDGSVEGKLNELKKTLA